MKPFLHAKGSVARWGGSPEDYLEIHDFIDQTKIAMPDLRHRAVLHNAFGCFLVERVFGHTFKNSDGKEVSTRDVAEQHIIEDMGFLPSLEDWISDLPQAAWHGGIHRLSKDKRDQSPVSAKGRFMSLKTAMENLINARKAYEEKKKALGTDAAKSFVDFIGEKLPPGFMIIWTQYTPYFNDGDACEFGVGERYLTRLTADDDNDDDLEICEYEEREGTICLYEGVSNKLDGVPKENIQALSKAFAEIPDDMFEAAFGDHVKVAIRKNNDGKVTWKTSEHSHD